ncbi:hypothetical protein VTL71DRAFT_6041 [Oculimacula yallundae]|uniref:Impact N-terminal domain-containing protein n=1 Tax=Oculimacula yallundae TaxID=86028 RepID=A0ABR4BZ83_9HELO
MAAQKDMQDLLRLLTTGRNKIPMLAAMGRVKALQGASLRSITDIAGSDISTLSTALSCDEKTAKALLAACKAHIKSGSPAIGGTKRASSPSLSSSNKVQRSAYSLPTPLSPSSLEASLVLPQPSTDEEAISKSIIVTNRAPLVLAFAVQLLKYTMPEQPLSARLSLAQAVCSANSRSKAVSIGLEKKGNEEEWGRGQPKVRVMGREVSVLKRSGYEWKEEQSTAESEQTIKAESEDGDGNEDTKTQTAQPSTSTPAPKNEWTVSAPITLKSSTFIARSHPLTSASSASHLLTSLLTSTPSLKGASHNITAYRILSPTPNSPNNITESSHDDGESGGGQHILSLLRSENVTNTLLVVSRWYGGVMLGTDRWRIMNMVCRDALSQRLKITGVVDGGDALWGLDLSSSATAGESGMPICRPEGARAYILKAFSSPDAPANTPTDTDTNGAANVKKEKKPKKKSGKELDREREDNLGLLLGALDLLFASWVGVLSKEELDRRAWGWYVNVRPDVQDGIAGWGGKGVVRLKDILALRRKVEGN